MSGVQEKIASSRGTAQHCLGQKKFPVNQNPLCSLTSLSVMLAISVEALNFNIYFIIRTFFLIAFFSCFLITSFSNAYICSGLNEIFADSKAKLVVDTSVDITARTCFV